MYLPNTWGVCNNLKLLGVTPLVLPRRSRIRESDPGNYNGVFLSDMHFQLLYFLYSYKYFNFLKATFYF